MMSRRKRMESTSMIGGRTEESAEQPDLSHADRMVVAQGSIDILRSGLIAGWALATVEGRVMPLLEVRIVHESGLVIAQGYATEYRADVQEAGLATAWCGFALPHEQDMPANGLLSLQVMAEGVWVLASQIPLELVPKEQSYAAVDDASEFFADLLSTFGLARTTGGIIGKGTLRIGENLWIQAASDVAQDTRAMLRLEEHGDSGERPYIHLKRKAGPISRADVRYRFLRSVRPGSGLRLSLPIRREWSGSGSLQLSLFTESGRTVIGTFSPPAGRWVTLEASLPPTESHGSSSDRSVWLEVIVKGLPSIDLGAPEVREARNDLFECFRVGAQQQVILAAGNAPALESEPEDFTVVVPFYGKRAYTGHCVDAVLANSAHRVHVLLVDDGSPDGIANRFLGGLRDRVEIVSLSTNRGYTTAVNAGVQAVRTNKVVILNSDTRVTPGWDVPLLRALDDETVFAAGPLSNAASYQSVPKQRMDGDWAVNELPASVRPADLAAALASEFGVSYIDWPILNGFCYAVRTKDFIETGMLDASAFPRGYGEEVDLMLRSRAAGLRNVIVPGSFVYHYKSKTFMNMRSELTAAANFVLEERWREQLATAISDMDSSAELPDLRGRFNNLLATLVEGGSR